jgi:tRNA/rRNA methyltransferase
MTTTGIKIILVEPAGPLNVGSTARVMKNFGLNKLVLVNPQCDYLGAEAKLMAVRALNILESAVVVDSLPVALIGCKRTIATTGIDHDWNAPLETPRTALPWLLEEVGQPSALIFGREDRGLSNQELNYAQRFIRIPSSEEYSSLNLAMAVGICCYELAQQADIFLNQTDVTEIPTAFQLAPVEVVESYYQQLELLLIKIGYLFPHTATSRMERFRQLYNRAQLQNRELSMLRGILRQVEWALGNKNHTP